MIANCDQDASPRDISPLVELYTLLIILLFLSNMCDGVALSCWLWLHACLTCADLQ